MLLFPILDYFVVKQRVLIKEKQTYLIYEFYE